MSENDTDDVRPDPALADGQRWLAESNLCARYRLAETGKYVIELEGEIDVYTGRFLRDFLMEVIDGGYYSICLDLDRGEFADHTGMGVIVGQLKRCRAHDGNLTIVCSQERIRKMFHIQGLTKIINIYDTRAEALA